MFQVSSEWSMPYLLRLAAGCNSDTNPCARTFCHIQKEGDRSGLQGHRRARLRHVADCCQSSLEFPAGSLTTRGTRCKPQLSCFPPALTLQRVRDRLKPMAGRIGSFFSSIYPPPSSCGGGDGSHTAPPLTGWPLQDRTRPFGVLVCPLLRNLVVLGPVVLELLALGPFCRFRPF